MQVELQRSIFNQEEPVVAIRITTDSRIFEQCNYLDLAIVMKSTYYADGDIQHKEVDDKSRMQNEKIESKQNNKNFSKILDPYIKSNINQQPLENIIEEDKESFYQQDTVKIKNFESSYGKINSHGNDLKNIPSRRYTTQLQSKYDPQQKEGRFSEYDYINSSSMLHPQSTLNSMNFMQKDSFGTVPSQNNLTIKSPDKNYVEKMFNSNNFKSQFSNKNIVTNTKMDDFLKDKKL